MSVQIQLEPDNLYVCRVSGILKRSEFAASQDDLARDIDAGAKPRVLAIFENFGGWERGADWNDLDFLFSHSHQIARIAMVGDAKWEAEALAFAGAGFRQAPVKFFPPDQEAEARAWLAE